MQFTTPVPLPESISVETGLQHVSEQLIVAFRQFLESSYVEREIGKDTCSKLLNELRTFDQSLWRFSWDFRQEFVKKSGSLRSTSPYWCVIDGIGFFNDAHPGRWPYTREPDQFRSLRWSLDEALNALSLVYH